MAAGVMIGAVALALMIGTNLRLREREAHSRGVDTRRALDST